jgi:GNAT superfamily N-acetyltransferase
MSAIIIRPARPAEADDLTGIALRAKASWGYSEAFMAACQAELTITPARVQQGGIWVAEIDGRLAGFVGGTFRETEACVDPLFVDTPYQGRGVGQALMRTLLDACRARGVSLIDVDADPNAEAIYRRWGFETVGRVPSGSIPGRYLPRMQLRL